ncbi:MAG: hypothetical protein K2V38_04025, partial [Gemmataceae bacterium]|nr:hypothetical protein [Gemmataceae bacterium]
MTITLPDEMKDRLERQTRAAGFATVAEYLCWLAQQAESDPAEWTADDLGYAGEAELEAKLLDSLASPPVPVTPDFWTSLKEKVAARAAQTRG